MSKAKLLLVLCAVPNGTALKMAQEITEKHLAACVNIVNDVSSVFFWQERKCVDEEKVLLIKTTEAAWSSLQQYIVDNHPYEIPELIACPLTHVSPAYENWLRKEVNP
jgi:periplasmic divalent cation tolerance protein